MNEDELAELLKRTLRNRAQAIRPGPRPATQARLHPMTTSPAFSRRRITYVMSGLAAAAVVAMVAVAIAFNSQPRHTAVRVTPPAASNPGTVTPPTTAATSITVAPAPTTTTVPPLPTYPVPVGFAPVSVTFVSAMTGWVLGTVPCQTGSCAYLVRTSDGGRTWYGVPSPTAFSLSDPSTGQVSAEVRFANPTDGWIVVPGSAGDQLYVTYSGGRTWYPATKPGGPSATIEDIEASGGMVHALIEVSGGLALYSTAAYSDDWIPTGGPWPLSKALPAGLGVTLQGSSGWVLETGQAGAGAILGSSGHWAEWPEPCIESPGDGILGASSSQDISALCQAVSQTATPGRPDTVTESLYQSTDAGSSFTFAGAVPGQSISSAAQPSGVASTVVAATPDGLLTTTNSGKTWSTIDAGTAFGFVGFTTATQGVAIGGGAMYMTTDAGDTWSQVQF